ncbi:hypothetical protein BJ878DRAFT_20419 [Calycina marina]|uniref:Uncharacterized protein n=1 Tax=Calycina marina TaxID=1763456 RepID=A0A9P8CG17_9HELO|nr:hypothetical protein BJ878DRAFT_20419 [Calycina marina]
MVSLQTTNFYKIHKEIEQMDYADRQKTIAFHIKQQEMTLIDGRVSRARKKAAMLELLAIEEFSTLLKKIHRAQALLLLARYGKQVMDWDGMDDILDRTKECFDLCSAMQLEVHNDKNANTYQLLEQMKWDAIAVRMKWYNEDEDSDPDDMDIESDEAAVEYSKVAEEPGKKDMGIDLDTDTEYYVEYGKEEIVLDARATERDPDNDEDVFDAADDLEDVSEGQTSCWEANSGETSSEEDAGGEGNDGIVSGEQTKKTHLVRDGDHSFVIEKNDLGVFQDLADSISDDPAYAYTVQQFLNKCHYLGRKRMEKAMLDGADAIFQEEFLQPPAVETSTNAQQGWTTILSLRGPNPGIF